MTFASVSGSVSAVSVSVQWAEAVHSASDIDRKVEVLAVPDIDHSVVSGFAAVDVIGLRDAVQRSNLEIGVKCRPLMADRLVVFAVDYC